ncbi:hypothetical protein GCM10009609_06900 [Pseudonocardia aurantiaca]
MLDVARIQTVNWPWVLAWPVGLLALILVFNIVLFGAIGDAAPPDGRTTGALMSIYFVMLVVHLQTITQMFPFALGMGVTRRTFYAGTALLVTAQAAVYGVVLAALRLVESGTGGWGVGVRFFGLPFLVQSNVFAQWLAYTVPFLAVSAIGVFMGVVFKRWGQPGVYMVSLGSAVVLGGLAVLITWQRWWPAVGSFFTSQSTLVLLTVYPLLIALVLGGAGWLAIRRATP